MTETILLAQKKVTEKLVPAARPRGHRDHAAGLGTGTIAAAIPALGELPFDLLLAIPANPSLLNRYKRCQSLLENCLGPDSFFILYNPQFRPALGGGQLACGTDQVHFFHHTRYAERR